MRTIIPRTVSYKGTLQSEILGLCMFAMGDQDHLLSLGPPPICDEWSLGTVHGCRGNFDLSLLTEYIFLSILPSSLFMVLAVIRLAAIQIASRRNKGQSSWTNGGATQLRFYKLAVISCYVVLQLALLALGLQNGANATNITAAVLSLFATFTLAPLSWVEHSWSLRPSTLINLYLLVSIICDAIYTRTLWLRYLDTTIQDNGLAFASVASTALIIKTGLLFLESTEKPNTDWSKWTDEKRRPSPEEKAGVLSRSFLIWVHGILSKGRKTLISPIDLDPLREGLSTTQLSKSLRSSWSSGPGRLPHDRNKSVSFAWTTPEAKLTIVLIRTLKWSLLAPIIPRLCLAGFTFCQPLLLREFLRYFAGQPTFVSVDTGYVFIILYGTVYTGLAVSAAIYWRLVYKALVQIRGCIISAVYEKTVLDIDSSRADMDAPISLVSTDMERIITGVKDLHEVWANSLQTALAIWLLYRELGLACVAPAAVAVTSSIGSMLMSPHADKAQVSWMEATQERVGITARAVAGMKSVKLLGLSKAAYSWLDRLRTAELHAARHFRYIEVLTAVIAFMPLFLSPVFTFLVFVVQARATGEHLDTVKAFVTLSLLHLMTQPLVWLFQAVPLLVASLGCIDRVDKYLHGPSQKGSFENEHKAPEEQDAIIIRDGSLSWTWDDEKPVLSNINISIPARQLTLVVGPVASGKSTLAKALVGQLPYVLGDIHVDRSGGVAFCDQEPFLINDSIRANITGLSGSEFADPSWFDTVIQAVGLDKDLTAFPNGSETYVGSKGARLSGGQRQRVSIARALYSRNKTAVFDDVLSSLDATTKAHVFDNVLGSSGLLRKLDCTVVLFTHEVTLLPRADHIIVLGRDGRVDDAGSFEMLLQRSPYIQSLIIGEKNSGSLSSNSGSTVTALVVESSQKPTDGGGHDINSSSPQGEEPLLPSDQTRDDLTRRLGDASIYKYLVHHIGLWRTVVFVLLTCGSAIFSTIGPVWLKIWCSDDKLATRSETYYLGIYGVFQAMALLFLGLFAGFALTTLAVKVGKSLHQVLLSAAIWAPMTFFSTTDTGVITNRFSGDIILIDGDLSMSLLETLSSGLVAVVQMIYIAVAGPYVAIAYPVLLVCLYFVQSFYLKTSRQLRFLDLEARSPLQSQLLETIQGLATIRSYSWSRPSVERFQRAVDASQQPLYLLYMIQRWLQLVLELLIAATAVMLVAVALHLRSTSQGFLGVALIQLMSLSQELKMMVINYTNMETSLTAVSRIKSFEENTPSENSQDPGKTFQEAPEGWPQSGRLTLESVSVSYERNSSGSDSSYSSTDINQKRKVTTSLALNDFTLDIQAGQRIAVVGRSGSGKSTLLLSLARMVDLDSGSIHIDGLDTSRLSPSVVRSRAFNVIPQEAFFFYKTVAANLDPSGERSDEEILAALGKVHLLDVVMGDKIGGIRGKIENFDTEFSQGQKQLLALARALLKSSDSTAKIVLVDEATSSVDQHTAELMQDVIQRELADRGKTIIAVAHQLRTVMRFDLVVVMDSGTIIESGRPSDLYEDLTSAFRRLYDAQ